MSLQRDQTLPTYPKSSWLLQILIPAASAAPSSGQADLQALVLPPAPSLPPTPGLLEPRLETGPVPTRARPRSAAPL